MFVTNIVWIRYIFVTNICDIFTLNLSVMIVTKKYEIDTISSKSAKNSQNVTKVCDKNHRHDCNIVTIIGYKFFRTIFGHFLKMSQKFVTVLW